MEQPLVVNRSEAIQRGLSIEPPMLDEAQLGWLYDLAAQAPPGLGCEVGVFKGSSLACWASARPGQPLIAVDDFALHGARSDVWERSEELLRLALDQYGLGDQMMVLTCDSVSAAPLVEDGSLAFLFIDADHTEPGIGKDIELWPQKVMPGGIIIFHDYGSWKPHYYVTQAVDAWHNAAQWEELGQVGSAIAFMRPG